ncbi:MAG: threonylcarbamoyl-AMP synthase [Planctomycetota bacterium]|jgi:L-threonylcarbamoyladenylate synthase|nr:threonylcarbamoyl-AMP synthase [Planctomycetota bacterium]
MAKERIAIADDRNSAVSRAAAVLLDSGIVVFPTETVYGIGVLATDAKALARLRDVKQRPAPEPFQFLVADLDAAKGLGAVFSSRAARLARTFWPGPLTLVVPDGTNSGGTLGVRVPDSPFALALCRRVGGALISSSANPAGAPPPRDADAADVFGDAVDLLIDGGPAEGVASTVVKCVGDEFEILRSGGVGNGGIRAAWDGLLA